LEALVIVPSPTTVQSWLPPLLQCHAVTLAPETTAPFGAVASRHRAVLETLRNVLGVAACAGAARAVAPTAAAPTAAATAIFLFMFTFTFMFTGISFLAA